jgi:adenylate cyclase class 2
MEHKILEIEIKAYCDNPSEIRERLDKIGADYIETRKEEDIYFNHPARDFGKTDEALRLRFVNGKCRVTYKGPKVSSETKARIEHETGIEDIEVFSRILDSLGFTRNGEIKKVRELYVLKDMEITLDSIEGLGDFVEIEKQCLMSRNAELELFDTAARLGLSRFERRSYLELKYFS